MNELAEEDVWTSPSTDPAAFSAWDVTGRNPVSMNFPVCLQGKSFLYAFSRQIILAEHGKHVIDHIIVKGCMLPYDLDNNRMQSLKGFLRCRFIDVVLAKIWTESFRAFPVVAPVRRTSVKCESTNFQRQPVDFLENIRRIAPSQQDVVIRRKATCLYVVPRP